MVPCVVSKIMGDAIGNPVHCCSQNRRISRAPLCSSAAVVLGVASAGSIGRDFAIN
jgi:hypothetical protein